jgi:hypothetical protein
MYSWYRDGGQLAATPAGIIKTENGYNDCMLALDYAAQTKVMSTLNLFIF